MDMALNILDRVIDDVVGIVGIEPQVAAEFIGDDLRACFNVLSDNALYKRLLE